MADETSIDIVSAYKAWSAETVDEVYKAMDSIGKSMLDEVQRTSPVSSERPGKSPSDKRNAYGNRFYLPPDHYHGRYKKGWRKKSKKSADGFYCITASNRTDGNLTNLIDMGHNMIVRRNAKNGNGGRKYGRYEGTHLISAAQEKARRERDEAIERILGG